MRMKIYNEKLNENATAIPPTGVTFARKGLPRGEISRSTCACTQVSVNIPPQS